MIAKRTKFSPANYSKKNPKKAAIIKKAVKRGLIEYEETFRKLSNN